MHQNFPGQFRHLAPALARRGHEVRALTDAANRQEAGVPAWRYRFVAPEVDPAATRLGRNYTTMSDRGVTVARAAARLRDRHGYVPDLIVGHSGWGETLFLRDVWPGARQLVYAEFHYRGHGADIGFDPEFARPTLDGAMIATGRAAYLVQSLAMADRALSPTRWQASTWPPALRPLIAVIFDGVDTRELAPDPQAMFEVPGGGPVLRAGDEVLTFVNRNLEPYRGYHVFMRALPGVLAARPAAQVVIVGGDGVSYGPPPEGGGGWKDVFLNEVRDRLDPARVHFTGRLPRAALTRLLQVSRVHAYLTYPFVLSWSMIEAMACGALVVASRTPPVQEVIRDGENGLLVDFFDVPGWSRRLADALAGPMLYAPLRAQARADVVARLDLGSVCLPAQIALVEGMV